MPDPRPSTHMPAVVVSEFEKAEKTDWEDGIPLTDLLHLVNRVAVRFLPEDDGRIGRAKRLFTPRSFRHYQTFGCIDPPARRGNRVFYGCRHFIQALLVRKLLWERVPAERIAALMAGNSTEELRRMFFEGIEIVARGGMAESVPRPERMGAAAPGAVEIWRHIGVAPGIALLLHSDLTNPRPGELREWLTRIEAAIRRNL